MGVLPCSRFGCRSIMCDRYSPDYGYICEDCFQELLEYRKNGGKISIHDFMGSEKDSYIDLGKGEENYLERVFPREGRRRDGYDL